MPRKRKASSRQGNGNASRYSARNFWLWCVIIALVPAAIYAQTALFRLLEWDDPLNITRNPHLMPPSWHGLAELWKAPYAGLYVPMAYTFLAGETWLALHLGTATEPFWGIYHLGSVGLHITNTLLVFVLLRRLVGRELPAALGALLFAVHPLQVESVAWITETRGLLSATFGLSTIWLYVSWVDTRGDFKTGAEPAASDTASSPSSARSNFALLGKPAVAPKPRFETPSNDSTGSWRVSGWYMAALATFILAVLSKPSAVSIPLVLLVVDFAILRRSWRAIGLSLGPMVALALVLAAITKTQQSGDVVPEVAPPIDRPRLAGDAISFYLYKLFVPWNLAPDYGRPVHRLVAAGWTWLTAALPIAIAAVLVWRRQWKLLTAAAVFVVALLPVLGFIPFVYQSYYSTVADRYAYLALLGPAFALAWWLADQKAGWAVPAAAGILGVLALLSAFQVRFWRNETALFRHALDVSPQSALAWDEVGRQLVQQGQAEKALEYFFKAQKLHPGFFTAFNDAGTTLAGLQRLPEAEDQFAAVVRLIPNDHIARYNLGNALVLQDRLGEAERSFAEALRCDPNFHLARCAYALALGAQGKSQAALQQVDHVLLRKPNEPQALSAKGRILAHIGQDAAAEPFLAAAVRLNSADVEARQALDQVRARLQAGSRGP
ncbi:MAG: tetratricopeptide repeat protein [Pirellulales bacterium]|nr:tetratricopeptide repeat protein [Pirellulales bacterium]